MARVRISLLVVLIALSMGGWFQHLYTCSTTNEWGFLIAGAVIALIGVIHGWGVWLGIW